MTTATSFREATMADVGAVMDLVACRIDWMNAVGLHQWNDTDYFGRYPRTYWEANIGRFLVGERRGKVVVAIALYADDVRWGAMPDRAYYLHHLVTDPEAKGVGVEMMRHVEHFAAAHGIAVLRLDSAVGNTVLERYYTDLGYHECGRCQDRLYFGVLREKRLAL